MTHEFFVAGAVTTVLIVLYGYLCWTLRKIVAELKMTQQQLNGSRLLTTKFDQATKLIGDLSGLQEQLAECKSGLHNTMFYVKKLRSEFQAQHRCMSELLARLDKLEGELRSTSGEIKENVTKAYKVMQYYDVSLSPRAPFPFGDEDGGSGGSGQQLLPANLL